MDHREESRKLAAILVADVAGFSRLMEADERGTYRALLKHRRELIDPAIAMYRGRLVKTTGDGFLVAFDSAVEALRFAVAMQRGMAERNVGLDENRRIAFRVGLNVGDIIVERDDIFGDGVNVAARLESLSEPGGICTSRGTYEQVRNAVEAAFVDLGVHVVKNIERPIEVYALPASVIAELPIVVFDGGPRRRFWGQKSVVIWALAATIAATAAIISFGRWHGAAPKNLQQDLVSLLGQILPDTNETTRQKSVDQFFGSRRHRSLVLAPRSSVRWASGDWSTKTEAEDRGLERCQVAFDEPCSVIAADDEVASVARDNLLPTRDMPRARYAGVFDPDRLPGVRPSIVKRADVVGYAAASGPKAAAYNFRGLIFVVQNAASQNEAEATALKRCNAEPSRRDLGSGCLLYASGNQVVLPERRTVPRAAP